MKPHVLAVLIMNIGCASASAQRDGGDSRFDKLAADIAASKKAVSSDVPPNSDLRGELLKMKEADQSAREAWIASGLKDEKLSRRVAEIDAANTSRLHEIVDASGWPKISKVGWDGSDAAWLVVQHAVQDLPFMERCLRLMEPLAASGEVSKRNLAYLMDRLLQLRNLPQRYGTQWRLVGGDYAPYPIEDPDHVEERRAAVGLDTMAQNRERMRATYAPTLKPQEPEP